MNGTLLAKACNMLITYNVPSYLKNEDINIATYITNRCLISKNNRLISKKIIQASSLM